MTWARRRRCQFCFSFWSSGSPWRSLDCSVRSGTCDAPFGNSSEESSSGSEVHRACRCGIAIPLPLLLDVWGVPSAHPGNLRRCLPAELEDVLPGAFHPRELSKPLHQGAVQSVSSQYTFRGGGRPGAWFFFLFRFGVGVRPRILFLGVL